MSEATIGRTSVMLAIELIDPPQLDARIDRDPAQMEELSRDILRRGLIEPIKVVRAGERYEAVDGWSRTLASKAAGLTTIEAFVYETKEIAHEGIKYAANIFRLAMTPCDEALMFRELLSTECGGDIERLSAMTGKRIGYLDDRLALLSGDELVFDALKAGKLKLGVAHELNKIDEEDYRRYYLQLAIQNTPTVAVFAGWMQDYRIQRAAREGAPAPPILVPSAFGYTSTFDPMRCAVCGKSDHRMTGQVHVHASCQEAILDPLLATYRGEA